MKEVEGTDPDGGQAPNQRQKIGADLDPDKNGIPQARIGKPHRGTHQNHHHRDARIDPDLQDAHYPRTRARHPPRLQQGHP